MKLIRVLLACGIMFFASQDVIFAKESKVVVERGKKVALDYTLTVEGSVVDSSNGQTPLTYTQGDGTIIRGLAKQLEGMSVGEEKDITVIPGEAYGYYMRNAQVEVPISRMPKDIELKPGTVLQGRDSNGKVFPVRVIEVKKDAIVVDHNHPLAGKTLNFHVKIVGIE